MFYSVRSCYILRPYYIPCVLQYSIASERRKTEEPNSILYKIFKTFNLYVSHNLPRGIGKDKKKILKKMLSTVFQGHNLLATHLPGYFNFNFKHPLPCDHLCSFLAYVNMQLFWPCTKEAIFPLNIFPSFSPWRHIQIGVHIVLGLLLAGPAYCATSRSCTYHGLACSIF